MALKIQFSFPFPEFSQGPNMELIKTNSNIEMDETSLKENNKNENSLKDKTFAGR